MRETPPTVTDRDAVRLASWVVSGGRPENPGDPMNVPIVPVSNYNFGGDRSYARDQGTPTVHALEALMAGMEGGQAVAFGSGMAAVAAVFELLAPDSLVVLPDDCYQGVAELASVGQEGGRWCVQRLALEDSEAWCRAAAEADLLWLESPSNPLLGVADLPAICGSERKPGNLIAVDNTFATPFNQRPLSFGADLVMHSATKFIGGHSDLLMGVVVAGSEDLHGRVRSARVRTGGFPGALEAFLTLRGARTLSVRLERAQASAGEVARRLEAHPSVDVVRYPGLSSHPSHATAARVLNGFGAMITFDVTGDARRADAVCAALRLIRHATSLGGVESSMERRAAHTGQEHLPATLLRLSVGCEHVEDIWTDLSQAFEATEA